MVGVVGEGVSKNNFYSYVPHCIPKPSEAVVFRKAFTTEILFFFRFFAAAFAKPLSS